MSGQQERGRTVELYFSTDMTAQRAVEYLGYPARQCLERWLCQNPRHAEYAHNSPCIVIHQTRSDSVCRTTPSQWKWSGLDLVPRVA